MSKNINIHTIPIKCKEFLECIRGCNKLLLRGFHIRYEDEIICMPCLKDRKPRDTSLILHKIIDDWFFENFGKRYRSNVVICTSNWDTAQHYGQYGEVRAIFPIGQFSVCWSPEVSDYYIYSMSPRRYFPDDTQEIKKLIATLEYREGDIDQAILSDSEILVHCEEFLSVKVKSEQDVFELMRKLF